MKKFFILAFMVSIAAVAEAKHPVVQESVSEAESYKVQAPQTEKEAARQVAGEGYKRRHKVERNTARPEPVAPSESSSGVQYWQYSE